MMLYVMLYVNVYEYIYIYIMYITFTMMRSDGYGHDYVHMFIIILTQWSPSMLVMFPSPGEQHCDLCTPQEPSTHMWSPFVCCVTCCLQSLPFA